MRKTILAIAAALSLSACQTAGGPSGFSSDNKPSVVTSLSVPAAQTAAKAIFTRPTLAFRVTSEQPGRLLFSKTLPADVNDNNPLKDRTKGRPVSQIELVFQPVEAGTRVSGDNWILLNPAGANKDKFNLLETPDGRRLQNKLNELK
ncbi:hypothetical protein FMN50_02020 [Rhodobacterales bacterium]|nr:hypothetical protein FMN50_02020 [Rhodobacterales bacterium]